MLSGFLGQTQPRPQSANETIVKLCDRLLHSTLLEDRRAAVLGLKGFSREYREDVASGGLRGLMDCLHRDVEDLETCRAALETLVILFIKDTDEGQMAQEKARYVRQKHKKYASPLLMENGPVDGISLWLTDQFTQNNDNILALLKLVEGEDFFVKLYALQLLSAIISNRPEKAQECLFGAPAAISVLVGALDDPQEIVRNEAILVLVSLATDHADVQKLVAFEGAFDKLFSIIESEGGLDGDVVVRDCLSLLSVLLRYNASNQHQFRETNCVPRLGALLSLPVNEQGEILVQWDDSLVSNVIGVLEICRLFFMEGHDATPTNQLVFSRAGFLFSILRIAFGFSTPTSIRTAAMLTSSEFVRGNVTVQHEFLDIDVPSVDLTVGTAVRTVDFVPVTQALLRWALLANSIHVFDLRVAAQRCLNSALHGNMSATLGFVREQIAAYTGEELANGDGANDDDKREENDKEKEKDTPSDKNVQNVQNMAVDRPSPAPSSQLNFSPSDANIFSALLDYDPDSHLNPYKQWFASVILLNIFKESTEIQDTVRELKIGNESEGQEVISCIQAMSGMLVTSLQYRDPRIAIAYMMLLTYWLYDDVKAVDDFLAESSTVQALIAYISQGGRNSFAESLAVILLGVTYDFSSSKSPLPR